MCSSPSGASCRRGDRRAPSRFSAQQGSSPAMKRHVRQVTAVVTLLSMLAGGCAPARPFYFFEDGDKSHYKGVATEIEYPDVNTLVLDDVTQAQAPLTVAHNEPREFWDLTL